MTGVVGTVATRAAAALRIEVMEAPLNAGSRNDVLTLKHRRISSGQKKRGARIPQKLLPLEV